MSVENRHLKIRPVYQKFLLIQQKKTEFKPLLNFVEKVLFVILGSTCCQITFGIVSIHWFALCFFVFSKWSTGIQMPDTILSNSILITPEH